MQADSPFAKERYADLVEDALKHALQSGADAAEVSISYEKGFTVSARNDDVETLEHHQGKGFGVTVYHETRQGHASTSDLSISAIKQAVQHACGIARYAGQDKCAGLPDQALLAQHYPDLELYHPWDISPTKAIEMAIECESVAREQDARIKDSEGAAVSTFDNYTLLANSDGFVGGYSSSEHSISCTVVAEENNEMQRDHEYTLARRPSDLDDHVLVAKRAAERTVQRLGARKLSTRRCPVIYHAPYAKGLLRSFLSAISGGAQYRQSSFLLDHIEQQVFPEHIHIHQRPHLLAAMGSAPFDREGVVTRDLDYVKDGVLQNYILNTYSARRLGLQTTGNSGGAFNLEINHCDKNLLHLLQEMDTGLLITDLMGQGVNMVTGDYSRGASGYWIENGQMQYPVEEITVAGNLRDMFMGLQYIGNDIDRRGNIHTGSILINQMTIAGH